MRKSLPKAERPARESGSFQAAQKSRILHAALLLTGVTALLIAGLFILGGDLPFAGILAAVSVFSWLCMFLNRRHYTNLAAIIFSVVVYLAIFYAVLNRSEFLNPGLIALPTLILSMGFFFNKRAIVFATTISIATLAIIYILHQIGILSLDPPPTLDELAIQSITLAVTGMMVWAIVGIQDYQVADTFNSIVSRLGSAVGMDHRRRSTSQLDQPEVNFRQFAQTSTDAMLLMNAEGKIIFVNQSAEQLFSLASNKILSQSIASFLIEPDSVRWLQDVNRVLELQDEIQVHEIQGFAIRDGEQEFPIKLSYSAWRSGADKYICAILRDLTEQMEAQKWLVFQERLGTLGSLVAGVAHDFNNALIPITLNTQLMLRDEELTPEVKQNLEIVLRQAKHAGELSRQLLTYSSQSQASLQPANLKQILREIETLLERTFPENVALSLEAKPGTYYLLGDPNRLEQALMNLAINARDAMPEGGELRMRLSKQLLTPADNLPFPGMQAGEWIRLDVTDSGEGILAEDIPHIFEPFFTTKAEGEGYGLGLAQTYNIVKQHKGFIDVVSRLGRGSTFTLFLPPLEGDEPIHLGEESLDALMGSQQSIMVVEDDPESLRVISETLEHLNYRVKGITNGMDAVSTYQQHEIDLVLSDMVMPDIDGLQLHDKLSSIDPQVKMIIFSGYSLDEVSSELLERGVLGLLRKPVTISTLAGSIHKALH